MLKLEIRGFVFSSIQYRNTQTSDVIASKLLKVVVQSLLEFQLLFQVIFNPGFVEEMLLSTGTISQYGYN